MIYSHKLWLVAITITVYNKYIPTTNYSQQNKSKPLITLLKSRKMFIL